MRLRLFSWLTLLVSLSCCSDDNPAPSDLALGEAIAGDLAGPPLDLRRSDGGQTCDEMKAELAIQVELAKVCQPQSSSKECTRLIKQDELPCGCPIFINPANATALKRIDDLLSAWRRKGCGAKIDCKTCSTPTTGTCEATPQGSKVPGLCTSL